MTRHHRIAPFLISLSLAACGYSQKSGIRKVRENESLRSQLTEQRQAHRKYQSDYSAALQEIDDLKRQLTERGINLENLNASLAEQRRALEEYARAAPSSSTPSASASRRCRPSCRSSRSSGSRSRCATNQMLIQLLVTCSSTPARTS